MAGSPYPSSDRSLLLSLPREILDKILDFALNVRLEFAYGPPRTVLELLDPAKRRRDEDSIRRNQGSTRLHEPERDSQEYGLDIVKSRLITSATSLLRVSKTIAAAAESFLCREETVRFVDDLNNSLDWSFKPSVKFRGPLRRSRFLFASSYDNTTIFFNRLPASAKQYIYSVVITDKVLYIDPEEPHNYMYTSIARASFRGLEGAIRQDDEYMELIQALLRLPSLDEVAVYFAPRTATMYGYIYPFHQNLLHVLYWGRLQRLHLFSSDLYCEEMLDNLKEEVLPRIPLAYLGQADTKPVPLFLDGWFSHASTRAVRRLKTNTRLAGIDLGLEESPPGLLSWRDLPGADAVLTCVRPNGPRRHETVPARNAPDSEWETFFGLNS